MKFRRYCNRDNQKVTLQKKLNVHTKCIGHPVTASPLSTTKIGNKQLKMFIHKYSKYQPYSATTRQNTSINGNIISAVHNHRDTNYAQKKFLAT